MRRRKIRIPGGARPWMVVLPESYHDNPNIVVVSVKKGTMTRIGMTPDGYRIGLLETPQGVRGLQVIGAGGGYVDHQTVIEDQYKVRMADYQYSGALSRMPDKLLLDDDCPLLFLRDRMGEPFFHLKQYLWTVSKGDDDRNLN